MKVLVAIPVVGQFEIGRIALYQFDRTASPDCQFLLIDNGPDDSPYASLFTRGFLAHNRWLYRHNRRNIGLIASAQQAYNVALEFGADILVLTHNDVWLYPESVGFHCPMGWEGWVESLQAEFSGHMEGHYGEFLVTTKNGEVHKYSSHKLERIKEDVKKFGVTYQWVPDRPVELGVVGLFGSKGCGREGHRLDTFGSLIEMAGHGRKMEKWIEPAVCLDGFFLACSMAMLKDAGGFDQRYTMHHVYDYDIALTSLDLGYRNAVLNIPCHHLSGLTANNDAKATSGEDIHHANYQRWLTKWSGKLGVTVNENWEYAWKCGQ